MWRDAPSLVRIQCSHKLEKIAAADCMAGSEQGQGPRMFGQDIAKRICRHQHPADDSSVNNSNQNRGNLYLSIFAMHLGQNTNTKPLQNFFIVRFGQNSEIAIPSADAV